MIEDVNQERVPFDECDTITVSAAMGVSGYPTGKYTEFFNEGKWCSAGQVYIGIDRAVEAMKKIDDSEPCPKHSTCYHTSVCKYLPDHSGVGCYDEIRQWPVDRKRNDPLILKDVDSEWSTTSGAHEVTTHTRMVGGVLCRWWGGGPEPSGVSLIDKAIELRKVNVKCKCLVSPINETPDHPMLVPKIVGYKTMFVKDCPIHGSMV